MKSINFIWYLYTLCPMGIYQQYLGAYFLFAVALMILLYTKLPDKDMTLSGVTATAKTVNLNSETLVDINCPNYLQERFFQFSSMHLLAALSSVINARQKRVNWYLEENTDE